MYKKTFPIWGLVLILITGCGGMKPTRTGFTDGGRVIDIEATHQATLQSKPQARHAMGKVTRMPNGNYYGASGGSKYHIPFESSGTPNPDAIVLLTGKIMDRNTSQPIWGDVYLNGELVQENVHIFELTLPNVFDGVVSTVADGYAPLKLNVQYEPLDKSKFIDTPFFMKPAGRPTTTPVALPTLIPGGGLVEIPLEGAGTPEANPVMEIKLTVADAVTQEPILATLYVLRGGCRTPAPADAMTVNSNYLEATLPPRMEGCLIIEAEGYETWRQMFNYQITTSRALEGPILLTRLKDQI